MNDIAPNGIRGEFARGWPAPLLAAAAICVGTMGIGFYSLGLFVKPLQDEFGWSRAAVSGAATFQQLGIFASAPLVGILIDRIGVRAVALASYIATPIALVALSLAGPSVAAWYALWFCVSVAGCGTTPVVWARVVTMRFDEARGLALGVMLLGTALAAILAPSLLGQIVVAHGWRPALWTMAAATAAVGILVSLLAADRPGPRHGKGHATTRSFGVNRQTIRVQVIAILLGAIVAGLIIHLVPLLIDRGIGAIQAARMAAVIGVAVLFARIVIGVLFDRFHAPYVAALFLLAPVASALLLLSNGPIMPAAFLLGIAAGAEVDMLAYLIGRYAPLDRYGATYGVTVGLFCLGAAVGPPLVGWSVDLTGSYDRALIGSASGLLAVIALTASLGPYRNAIHAVD